ncbi:hypothetical protein ACQP1K_02960 [Sphaerimonospora sp. CA-214678]|uniref:hypothetical protein n=1 Tax=Sphaerimonospora sp. CA-214678 TaxID=3240029 RepID=UPI003D8FBD6A
MDANSRGAADLLRALMRTAARFSETGRSLSDANFPHVRWVPISDLAGRAVRLGLELALPGHEIVFELSVAVRTDGGFAVRGEIVLDGEDVFLDLPPAEIADVAACTATLDRYADELIAPARGQVGRLLEQCPS